MLSPKDLPLLCVFAAVVRHGSFVGAARELGVAKSVVSEQVRALEERCEVRLLERTTRRLHLTQVGERVLEMANGVVDATRAIGAVLEEERDAAVGTLRIATTLDLGPRLVAPAAARVAAQHAKVRVDIVADDAQHDLIAERFDVAIRLGEPRDSTQGIRRLGRFVEPIVCAPALAARYAHARRPRDLAGAPWVRHTLVSRRSVLRFTRGRDVEEVEVDMRAQANTADALRALVLAGAGLGVLPEYLIRDDMKSAALLRVCPDWIGKEPWLFAVLPSPRRAPKRVTLFLDELRLDVDRLRDHSTRAPSAASSTTRAPVALR